MKRAPQYHIGVGPGEAAPTILLCGDPERAERISKRFDKVRLKRAHREFVTYTGVYQGAPVSVMGTGIGPDNTELAVVELSQVVKSPTFIRLGSSGALRPDMRIGDLVVSSGGVRLENTSLAYVPQGYPAVGNYEVLLALIKACGASRYPFHVGLTATAPGFYGAQGREMPGFEPWDKGAWAKFSRIGVLNFEMETSALFTLASVAGHRAGAVCAVYAERPRGVFANAAQRVKAEARVIEVGLSAVAALGAIDRAKARRRSRYYVPEAV